MIERDSFTETVRIMSRDPVFVALVDSGKMTPASIVDDLLVRLPRKFDTVPSAKARYDWLVANRAETEQIITTILGEC